MNKTLKTIIATLLLGSAAVTFAAQVQAAKAPSQQERSWMERASKNYDGGGY